MTSPSITVLITAYNVEQYITETIESVLNQTFSDFELLIIDDGSTDNTVSKIESFDDNRILLLKNGENKGIQYSANRGLKIAKGKYIARLDADDIAMPYRLEKQFIFMEKNPEIGICGTWTETFGNQENQIWKPPLLHDELVIQILFQNPFVQSSIIIRNQILKDYNLNYRYHLAEDYDLWIRISNIAKIANIPEVLTLYRQHDSQISTQKKAQLEEIAYYIRLEELNNKFDNLSPESLAAYNNYIKETDKSHTNSLALISLFDEFLNKNKSYNPVILKKTLRQFSKISIRQAQSFNTFKNPLYFFKSAINVLGVRFALKMYYYILKTS